MSDQSRSRSSSDCASLYSHEEANLIEKLQSTDKIDVKVHETGHGHSFATLPDKMTSHDDLLRHESTDTGEISDESVSRPVIGQLRSFLCSHWLKLNQRSSFITGLTSSTSVSQLYR